VRRLLILTALTAVPLGVWGVSPIRSSGAPSGEQIAALGDRIEAAERRVRAKRRREARLRGDLTAFQGRLDRLARREVGLQQRQAALQQVVDGSRARLVVTQRRLRAQRARVTRLRARLAEARSALARRLVLRYQADMPDLVTVAMNADGFADLLERSEFLERVQAQDRLVVRLVHGARLSAADAVRRLDELERVRRAATRELAGRRDDVSNVRLAVVGARNEVAEARAARRQSLILTQVSRRRQERQLDALQREQRRVVAALRRAQTRLASSPGSGLPAALKDAGGRLALPVAGPLTSPFGPRWGRLHAGMDIAAAGGTPIRAAESGRVVLAAATGGYGLYTCIQHTTSLSTCYAHQSRLGTRPGALVSRGEVMGYVGNTGSSFGDHLHFEVRVDGTPVDPAGYL
jgi:murein DD-endopeptidase MepM/ murein hydrolase activator NlpD